MFEQEQIGYEESNTNRHTKVESSLISISSKVLAAYPGEQVFLSMQVNGPYNHVVELILKGPSENVVTIHVNPQKSQTPFTAIATINVNPGAPPGLCTLTITLYNIENNLQLANEISLIVPGKYVPKILANRYNRLVMMFNKYGSNGLVWYILKYIYPGRCIIQADKERVQADCQSCLFHLQVHHILHIHCFCPESSSNGIFSLRFLGKYHILRKLPVEPS